MAENNTERKPIDEEWVDKTYDRPYGVQNARIVQSPTNDSGVEGTTPEVAKSSNQKNKPSKLQLKSNKPQTSIKQIGVCVRTTVTAGTVGWVCLPLYGLQIIAAIIAISGFGLEEYSGEITAYFVPGESMVVFGWILSTLLALAQLGLAAFWLVVRGAKPFKTGGLTGLCVAFAFAFVPIGIPGVYLWLYMVVKDACDT